MKPTPRTVWIRRRIAQLAAQLRDAAVDRVQGRGRLTAPHAFKRKHAADHLSRVAEQQLEQLGLPCAQSDLALASTRSARLDLEDEVVEGEQLIRFAARRKSARARASSSSDANGLTR